MVMGIEVGRGERSVNNSYPFAAFGVKSARDRRGDVLLNLPPPTHQAVTPTHRDHYTRCCTVRRRHYCQQRRPTARYPS